MDSEIEESSFQWLLSMQSRGILPGLHRMERLLRLLGNPEKELRCLHVAGTNGKGSVCAFAESVLRAAGHRTGLYTSPHLVDFAERIRIDGRKVGEDLLEQGILRLRIASSEWQGQNQPTFFELVTALAFDLLARAGCEVVVLETGLGGRLDATNTAPKLACAITPIALDHTEWLGETLAEIAREKAGIFRAGVPAVIAPQEAEAAEILAEVARATGVPCDWIDLPLSSRLHLGLAGSYQRWNAAVALALIRAAGFDPSPEAIASGLAGVDWPGRFQSLRGGGLILDGAHNFHAARQLTSTWREEYGELRCRLIFGALSDKDPGALLAELLSIAGEVLLVPVVSPRSADPAVLVKNLSASGVPARVFDSLRGALESVFSQGATPGSPVLVAGSLFLVGEALALESGSGVAPRNQ